MNIKIVDDKFDSNKWNEEALHPLQSWEWGEVRGEHGIEVLRIGQFEKDKLENVFTITFHKIPHTNFKIGYLPRSVFPSNDVLEFLQSEEKKRNVVFIKIEPYVLNAGPVSSSSQASYLKYPLRLGPPPDSTPANFKKSSHPLFPSWTLMMDLTKSEDELLKNMKPKTRYNIRVAEKHAVEVRQMSNEKGFEIFSKLYFETTGRQKYRGHDHHYHKIIFDTLKNKIAHILIAYYKGTPLSAYELFIFNDVLYYPYGGSSIEHKNVMAANLLMWEAIKFGKKHGAKIFDMWGSEGPNYDKNSAWSGFTRFKEGYGAEFVEFTGSYELVLNPIVYSVYNILNIIRQKML